MNGKNKLRRSGVAIAAIAIAVVVLLAVSIVVAPSITGAAYTGDKKAFIEVTNVVGPDSPAPKVYATPVVLADTDTNGNVIFKYGKVSTTSIADYLKDGSLSTEEMIGLYTNLHSSGASDCHDGRGTACAESGTCYELIADATDASVYRTLEKVPAGLYVIQVEGTTVSVSFTIVPVNYIFNSSGIASIKTDSTDTVSIAVKYSATPGVSITVDENKYTDAEIGDDMSFETTVQIPNFDDTESDILYKITVSIPEGVDVDPDTIMFNDIPLGEYIDDPARDERTNAVVNDDSIVIELYKQDVYDLASPTEGTLKDSKITFDAELTNATGVNFDPSEVKATLNYPESVASTDATESVEDTCYAYTFGVDTIVNPNSEIPTTSKEITKYGVKTTGAGGTAAVELSGARFQVIDDSSNILYFDSNGKVTKSSATGAVPYVTSGTNGELKIEGLDAGTYKLKEVKAPEGYALNAVEYSIIVTPTYNTLTGQLTSYNTTITAGSNSITFTYTINADGTVTTSNTTGSDTTFAINNVPLTTLPKTGGVGVVVITACAIGAMVVFGTLFIVLKKKNADQ